MKIMLLRCDWFDFYMIIVGSISYLDLISVNRIIFCYGVLVFFWVSMLEESFFWI